MLETLQELQTELESIKKLLDGFSLQSAIVRASPTEKREILSLIRELHTALISFAVIHNSGHLFTQKDRDISRESLNAQLTKANL